MNKLNKAFPVVGSTVDDVYDDGMDLRDYFAAKAMQAMLSIEHVDKEVSTHSVAAYAYMQADAMMRQREEQE